MPYVLINAEKCILEEIADRQFSQRAVALTYAFAIHAQHAGQSVDFQKINEAIIARWSWSGLENIKQMAWKHCESPAA